MIQAYPDFMRREESEAVRMVMKINLGGQGRKNRKGSGEMRLKIMQGVYEDRGEGEKNKIKIVRLMIFTENQFIKLNIIIVILL